MLLGFAFGAIGGFVCAIIVVYFRGYGFPSDAAELDPKMWPGLIQFAAYQAAPLGAIYLAIASITLLRAEILLPAVAAVFVTTILFTFVGEKFVAPVSPLWLDASIGFWISCIAIYAHRSRDRDQSGWQSYFS